MPNTSVAGRHLADQLLLPMAVGAGGCFTTTPLSLHATTNIEVIRQFLDVGIDVQVVSNGVTRVVVEPCRSAGVSPAEQVGSSPRSL